MGRDEDLLVWRVRVVGFAGWCDWCLGAAVEYGVRVYGVGLADLVLSISMG